MVFLAVAIPASQVEDVAANEQFLLNAYRKKDGSTLYLAKAWHGIHFLLTGTQYEAKTVLGQALMGGRPIGKDQGYGPMRVLSPEQVRAIAEALSKVTPEELSARYDPQAFERADIYPSGMWVKEGLGALKYLLAFYGPLQAFYKKAAENGDAIVLIIA